MTPTTFLLHGDCLEMLPTLPDSSVDSIVTDPPYGLSFMGKKWDYDVPSESIWRECLRVLKPGGHLLAFAGTRTQHRMAVRIEDAGFEIRDMIAWVYGSGFPKSHNLKDEWQGWGTALKPALEPITVARKPLVGTVAENVLRHGTGALNIDGCRVPTGKDDDIHTKNPNTCGGFGHAGASVYGDSVGAPMYDPSKGRWPANLIHDGSDEVVGLFPETTSGAIKAGQPAGRDMRAGSEDHNRAGGRPAQPRDVAGPTGSAARFFYCAKASRRDRDEGLDSIRTVKHITGLCKSENMELAELLQKVTSESIVKWGIDESGESITGLCLSDSLSTTLTEISKITTSQICNLWTLSRTNESTAAVNCVETNGGNRAENAEKSNLFPPNTTSESQAESAHGAKSVVSKMLSEISDGENWKKGSNFHATVKPTDLMRYLCRLVTPVGGTVLDPFMGSGSTGKAAMKERFNFIGIERDEYYFKIAKARIENAKLSLSEMLI